MDNPDIVVVGGGLTGATLMLALENKGFKTLMIEAMPLAHKLEPDFDARTLALSPSTQRILNNLNLWEKLSPETTAIEMIEVSRQYHFGRSHLRQDELGPLGYIIEMQALNKVLVSRLPKKDILAPASVTAYDKETNRLTVNHKGKTVHLFPKLIVAADGSQSTLRSFTQLKVITKDYGQEALVTNIGLARHHHNIAYERFTAFGPLALLPSKNNRSALVWALSPKDAKNLVSCPEDFFLDALQKAFGYKLGKFLKVGKRVIYPIRQMVMPKNSDWPLVFIGNAAQTLHPAAGQGFNLGLRDVATLAECIVDIGLKPEALERYASMRKTDQKTIVNFTDQLVSFFSNQWPGFGLLQSLGLVTMDHFSLLQKILVRQARGFGGTLPLLVCKDGEL